METLEDIDPEVRALMQWICDELTYVEEARLQKMHETLSRFYSSPEGERVLDSSPTRLLAESVAELRPRNIGQILLEARSLFSPRRTTPYAIPPDDFYFED